MRRMHRWISMAAVAALICMTVAGEGIKVEVTITVIDGSTVDEDGVEGASVTLEGTEFSDFSDESGGVVLSDVPQGVYTIVVQADGYLDYSEPVEIDSERSDFKVVLRPRE